MREELILEVWKPAGLGQLRVERHDSSSHFFLLPATTTLPLFRPGRPRQNDVISLTPSYDLRNTRRKSKAYQVLLEGDQLISINGQPCEFLSHDEAMAIVESGCPELVIQVRRGAEHNKENENQPKDNPHPKIETQAAANAAAPVWTAPTGSSFFPKTSPTGSSTLSKGLLTSTSALPRAGLTLLGPLSDLGNIPRPFVPFQVKRKRSPWGVRFSFMPRRGNARTKPDCMQGGRNV
ncbi:hypothetical protein HPB48_006840 [Haemaphysalis longicornis]|uniref:PDZ domain-containing protein n=1 Tax=Haemaphysalis longicornis TaxID=44386 RepID=A0A9J6F767_HAELO|nr:hypothetical protein HPB48_006840 [Haemaphysalis longicornis]